MALNGVSTNEVEDLCIFIGSGPKCTSTSGYVVEEVLDL